MPGQTGHVVRVVRVDPPPSMEGRTIARPDWLIRTELLVLTLAFNGGPDNCPARLPVGTKIFTPLVFLQWRAGQLPGQTGVLALER